MEKPVTKLNRLYKKWEKAKADRTKVEEEIKVVCEEQGIDYGIIMQYMSGDPVTTALIQSYTTSLPVIQDIRKERKSNGSKERDSSADNTKL